MKKNTISVGDRVLQCIPWKPGMEPVEVKGEGLVTLIAEDRVRVMWTTGVFEWCPENELVNVKNVK